MQQYHCALPTSLIIISGCSNSVQVPSIPWATDSSSESAAGQGRPGRRPSARPANERAAHAAAARAASLESRRVGRGVGDQVATEQLHHSASHGS